jgi:predicted XRE-type DNA-binding protein
MVKNNNHSVFPPQEEFERVVKRAQKSDKRTNIGLLPDATPADKVKHKICQTIARYQRENNLSEKELAQKLGITHPQAEKILFCHIDKLNLDELVNYVGSLNIPLEMKVNGRYV